MVEGVEVVVRISIGSEPMLVFIQITGVRVIGGVFRNVVFSPDKYFTLAI